MRPVADRQVASTVRFLLGLEARRLRVTLFAATASRGYCIIPLLLKPLVHPFSYMPTDLTQIHFTGAAGSGATTLGRAVALRVKLTHFDTDDYLWAPSEPPYQQLRLKDDRVRLLETVLDASSGWVLSGSVAGWGDPLIGRFQLVVLVLTPTDLRLARLRERELQRFGHEALSPGGSLHQNHLEFLEWAALYDDGDESVRSLRLHEHWLSSLSCRTMRVDGRRPISTLVEEVLEKGRS